MNKVITYRGKNYFYRGQFEETRAKAKKVAEDLIRCTNSLVRIVPTTEIIKGKVYALYVRKAK